MSRLDLTTYMAGVRAGRGSLEYAVNMLMARLRDLGRVFTDPLLRLLDRLVP